MSGRKKRIYLGLMALGATALLVDRFVLSDGVTQPDSALAGDRLVSAPIAPPAGNSTVALPIPKIPFPRGLAPFDPDRAARDVFLPPAFVGERRDSGDGNMAAGDGSSARPGTTGTAMFITRHKLDGVLIDQGLKIAIVDGLWIRLGELLDGCKLTDISGQEARFECRDAQAVLAIAVAPGGAGAKVVGPDGR